MNYFKYRVDYGNTIIDQDEAPFVLQPSENQLYSGFIIPKLQPVYFYRVSGTSIVENTEQNINDWLQATSGGTGDLSNKLDKVAFIQYTGTTAPATYALKSKFNTYTGTTAPTTYHSKIDFNAFTGTTLPNQYATKAFVTGSSGNYVTRSVFTGYTATTNTAINSKVASTTFNLFTGATVAVVSSKLNTTVFNTFTGTTLPIDYIGRLEFNSFTGSTFGAITGATNGLTVTGKNIKLGGQLTELTTLESLDPNNNLTIKFGEDTVTPYNEFYVDSSGLGTQSRNSDNSEYGNYSLGNSFIVNGTGNLQMYFPSVDIGVGNGGLQGNSNGSMGIFWVDPNSSTGSSMTFENGRIFVNTFRSFGIEYFQDYSSGYKTRSLVDKGYVDNLVTIRGVGNGLTRQINNGIAKLGGTITATTTLTTSTGARLNFAGFPIQYSTDLSSNFGSRSLVDKGYVTGLTDNFVDKSTNQIIGGIKGFTSTVSANTLTIPAVGIGSTIQAFKLLSGQALFRNAGDYDATNSEGVVIEDTIGTAAGASIGIYRNTSSFSTGDDIGAIHWWMNSSTGVKTKMGTAHFEGVVNTNGSESARFISNIKLPNAVPVSEWLRAEPNATNNGANITFGRQNSPNAEVVYAFVNAGTGTAAYNRVSASQVAAGTQADSMSMILSGPSTSTTGVYRQDGGTFETGANLAGGMTILSRAASSEIRMVTGGINDSDTKLKITSTGIGLMMGATSHTARLQVRGVGSTTGTTLRIEDSAGIGRLVVLDNGITTIGGLASYTSDLSASFVPRSIVDKGYVTGLTNTLQTKTAFNVYSGTTNTRITTIENNYVTGYTSIVGTSILGTKLGRNLQFKGLIAGTNISLVPTASGITISASGAASTLTGVTNGLSLAGGGTRIKLGGPLTGATTIGLGTNSIVFTGTTGTLRYGGNYSANFVNRSLVDVSYVTGITNTLQTKASIAIYTGTTVPATYQSKSSIVVLTGTTLPTIYQTRSVFNTFTGTTNTRVTTIENNYVTGFTSLGNNTIIGTKSGRNLQFKGLAAGTNITLVPTSTGITISASGSAGTITGATNGVRLSGGGKRIALGGSLTGSTAINIAANNFTLTGTTGQFIHLNNNSFASPVTIQNFKTLNRDIFTLSSAGFTTWRFYNTAGVNVGAVGYTTPGGNPGIIITNSGATTRYDITHNPANNFLALYNNTIASTLISIGMGGSTIPTATFQVRGRGTANGTLFRLEDSTGTARMTMVDSGTTAFSSKVNLTPTTTLSGLNIGTFAGNPTNLSDGDLWYNSSGIHLAFRIAGATQYAMRTSTGGLGNIPYSQAAGTSFFNLTNNFAWDNTNAILTLNGKLALGSTGPVGSPTNGMIVYSGATTKFNFRENGAWVTYPTTTLVNTYTGTTAPATYQSKSSIVVLTGTTLPATYVANTKFNTYTGTTNTRFSTIENNYITGATSLGGNTIVGTKSGLNVRFKGLVAGTNVTLTPSSTGITISASGGGGSGTVTGATNGLRMSGGGRLTALGGILTGSTTVGLGSNNLTFTGTTGTLRYGSNVSAQFTPRSLVDKGYVTGLTATQKEVTGTTYVVTTEDKNSFIYATNVAGCTIVITNLGVGTEFGVGRKDGAGIVTFSGSGVTLKSTGNQLTSTKTSASWIQKTASEWYGFGGFGITGVTALSTAVNGLSLDGSGTKVKLGGIVTGATTIGLGSNNLIITASTGTLRYGSNLSTQFNVRSLVDKGYVTGFSTTFVSGATSLGGNTIVGTKSGRNLQFKGLVAGANITLTPTATGITIASSGGGGGGGTITDATNGLRLSGGGSMIALGGIITGTTTIGLGSNNITLTATTGTLRYGSDLSSQYNVRSLVDKGFVTGLTAIQREITGTTYVVKPEDKNALLYATNAGGCTFIFTNIEVGYSVGIVRTDGAGVVTITGSGVTINSTGYQLIMQNSAASMVQKSASVWYGFGGFDSNGITKEGTVEVNIASTAQRSGYFFITGVTVIADKPVYVHQALGPYTGKGTLDDETEMDAVIVSAKTVGNSSIKCIWRSQTSVRGNFKFNYLVGN